MRRNKAIAWIVLGVSLAALLGSVAEMARRVRAYQAVSDRQMPYFQPIADDSFRFAGRPVTIAEDRGERGVDYLRVTYGQDEIRLRVTIPPRYDLPGLREHDEWMRVLRFAEGRGRTARELEREIRAGRVQDHLVIVTRTPRPGTDPGTWGRVWKRDWVFDFYEFLPEGGFRHQTLRFPSARGGSRPERELREGTWQFYAALQVMPDGAVPKYTFTDDAFGWFGWTLPAASVSVIVFVGSLVVLFGPERKSVSGARWPGRR